MSKPNIAKAKQYIVVTYQEMASKIGLSSESSELFDREMKKMRDARVKMRTMATMARTNAAAAAAKKGGDYFDMTDMTDKDIAIVCEELWLDIKTWVCHDTNLSSCGEKVRMFISRNRLALICFVLFMIVFRWYVGGGKEACAYGVGWGAFSLVCEMMRYFGEVFMGVLLGICGFCCGVSPIIMCGCFHEIVNYNDEDNAEKEKNE
jgi:hypothetical protein